MAIKTRTELKAKFITGAKPVQEDFEDLLDSLNHKQDDKITELQNELASQTEAENGAVNNKLMTPLRVKQAIDVLAAAVAQGITDVAIANLIGGAAPAYDTLLELQNQLQNNDSELASLLALVNLRLTQQQVDERIRKERYTKYTYKGNDPDTINGTLTANTQGLAYLNGLFVAALAITGSLKVKLSMDGTRWFNTTSGIPGTTGIVPTGVAAGNGRIVIVFGIENTRSCTTTNFGSSWQTRSTGPYLKRVRFHPGTNLFYAIEERIDGSPFFYSSSDGLTWTARQDLGVVDQGDYEISLNDFVITADGRVLVFGFDDGNIPTSYCILEDITDLGSNFIPGTVLSSRNLRTACAIGDNFYVSDNLGDVHIINDFDSANQLVTGHQINVIQSVDKVLVAHSNTTTLVSVDFGTTWMQLGNNGEADMDMSEHVVVGNTLYIMGKNSSTLNTEPKILIIG